MIFDGENFESVPNFIYKETISKESDCLSNCDTFDCYKTKENDLILITPYIDSINFQNEDYFINLINLKNNKIIKKLEGHKVRITTVRMFQNPKTKKVYLISADIDDNVIIWDIQNNFKIIFEKKFEYEPFSFIYSTLLIFGEKNTWLVVSSISEKNKTLVVDINKNNNLIEILGSENLPVYSLSYWFNNDANTDNEKHNIIQCGKNEILITQFPINKTYFEIKTDEKYMYNSGSLVFKIKDQDMLAISACSGLIIIFDLIQKNIVKKIEMENVHFYSFIKWNENYLLLNDTRNRKIIVIDLNNDYKIVRKIYLPEMDMDVFMKKIIHPEYNESILTSGKNFKINLFILRGIWTNNEYNE